MSLSETAAALLTATAWGSMLFFLIAVAPSVFRFLEPQTAGKFIRRLFPVYYLTLLIVTALAAAALAAALPARTAEFTLMLLVAAGFALARQWLMPTINRLSDRVHNGDPAAKAGFRRWHGASVIVNLIQMALVLWVLYRLLG